MEHWKRTIERANRCFMLGELIDAREAYLQALALAQVLFARWADADEAVAACVMPHLFRVDDGDASKLVHDVEVFGPVATVVPYRDPEHAYRLARRGCLAEAADRRRVRSVAGDLGVGGGLLED